MNKSIHFDATIYCDGTVGITFKPTPNLTRKELRMIILDLKRLNLEMQGLYDKEKHGNYST